MALIVIGERFNGRPWRRPFKPSDHILMQTPLITLKTDQIVAAAGNDPIGNSVLTAHGVKGNG